MLKKLLELERQAGRKKGASPPTWYLAVQNKAALPIVALLLKTPITPNQVTFFGIIIGAFAISLFSHGQQHMTIIGILLLMFHYLLDSVDGRLARYKKITSLRGRYLDLIGHAFLLPGIFIFLTLGYANTGVEIALGFAAVISMSLMEAAYITKKACISEGLLQDKLHKKQFEKKAVGQASLPQKIFRSTVGFAYRSGDMFLVLLAFTLFNKTQWALYFYGATLPILALIRIYTTFKSFIPIEEEYKKKYQRKSKRS